MLFNSSAVLIPILDDRFSEEEALLNVSELLLFSAEEANVKNCVYNIIVETVAITVINLIRFFISYILSTFTDARTYGHPIFNYDEYVPSFMLFISENKSSSILFAVLAVELPP